MKLSIIIPAYNVGNTLKRCLESVLGQNIDDCEIILVDDGSTDKSAQICDEAAAKDNRIKVIHQTNQGLSEARNSGLNVAKGEYITFVDSDDYLAADTYQPLIDRLDSDKSIDFIEYSVYERTGNILKEHVLQLPEFEYTDMREYWLSGHAYLHTYAWNKVYKRELFENVRYPKGKTFEDVFTLPLILQNCKKVVTTEHGLYYYKWNKSGITATAKGNDLIALLRAHEAAFKNKIFSLIDAPSTNLNSKQAREIGEYYAHLLNIQMDVYEQTGSDPILPVLPYYNTWKLKLMHLIGMKNICRLNTHFHNLIRTL